MPLDHTDIKATQLAKALAPQWTSSQFMADWKQCDEQDRATLRQWLADELNAEAAK